MRYPREAPEPLNRGGGKNTNSGFQTSRAKKRLENQELAGAGDRSRTYDLRITNALLYQLSYTGSQAGGLYARGPGEANGAKAQEGSRNRLYPGLPLPHDLSPLMA